MIVESLVVLGLAAVFGGGVKKAAMAAAGLSAMADKKELRRQRDVLVSDEVSMGFYSHVLPTDLGEECPNPEFISDDEGNHFLITRAEMQSVIGVGLFSKDPATGALIMMEAAEDRLQEIKATPARRVECRPAK